MQISALRVGIVWPPAGQVLCLFILALTACSNAAGVGPTDRIDPQADLRAADVRVTTDKNGYRHGESIVVTIDNSLSVPIFALTGQAYCTIVTVQRLLDGRWTAEGRCMVGGPPGWIELSPHHVTRVEVRPRIALDEPLPPGRYRVLFTFKPQSTADPSLTVFSEEFVIAAE